MTPTETRDYLATKAKNWFKARRSDYRCARGEHDWISLGDLHTDCNERVEVYHCRWCQRIQLF